MIGTGERRDRRRMPRLDRFMRKMRPCAHDDHRMERAACLRTVTHTDLRLGVACASYGVAGREGVAMMNGSCLCGGVRFEIAGPRSKIGICHCSLCRKTSGTGSTATIAVAASNLRWICGQDSVTQFARPSGYGTSFCRTCGSPVPDPDSRRSMYQVPVGLLNDNPPLCVGDHIYVGSKAGWDEIGDAVPQFEGDGPDRPRDQVA